MNYEVRVTRPAGVRLFEVALTETMTVLDALFRIQAEQDSSLAFRCACRVGMCGTCAMEINEVPRLACKTRVSKLEARVIRLAPLENFPVIQDLVVSLEPFFRQWKRVKPAPRTSDSGELAIVPPNPDLSRKRDCITCGICYAACGVTRSNADYLGPAAINRAFLRIHDPRDGAAKARIRILNDERSGVWRCHTQFTCTELCPKKIDLTDTIGRVKRAMLTA